MKQTIVIDYRIREKICLSDAHVLLNLENELSSAFYLLMPSKTGCR